jgi:SAM-dependent methyltransferase
MAHVADIQRFLLQGPLFSKTSARADSQKRRLGPREQHLFFSQAQRKPAMRTATDFNLYYAAPDPWHISHARFRDKVLRRCLKPFIRRDKSVLELGCGEGHLTQTIFGKARSVVGIDISDVAIARAKSLNLPNARFESADFLQASFEGYDVIAALECVYYLSFQEQGVFFEKVAKEHPGKILLLSGPIVDYRRHFSHKRLMHEFTTLGFTPLKFYNLSVYWYPPSSRIIANLIKLPLGYTLLDWIPESMIYQRLYALRAPKRP